MMRSRPVVPENGTSVESGRAGPEDETVSPVFVVGLVGVFEVC